jgi:pyruvate formate lyase activating enzyme
MVETILYEKLHGKKVRCNICQRRCLIKESERGHCRTRVNRKGKLISLIYGVVSSIMISLAEKKPFFHFYPGSEWLSVGSLGCNFRCPGCQNWDIAHSDVEEDLKTSRYISSIELINIAKQRHCLGISWTYNEPTLWFEYTLDGAKLAKINNLYTNYVTNGFITIEALDLIGPYLDVFRVDLKGFSKGTYQRIASINDFTGILEVIKRAKQKWKMHVEIVTNVIPEYNDNEEELREMAKWIKKELGKDTPWHVTRFFPHLDLSYLKPTPVETLERIRKIGLKEGLNYVYLGNVPNHPGENTYCPNCGGLLIERSVYNIKKFVLINNRCPACETVIAGKF